MVKSSSICEEGAAAQGLDCIDNVRLVDQTTQQEYCVQESERIMGGSNVTGSNCLHPWQVALMVNVKSAMKRLLELIEVYKEKLQVDITCATCPSHPLGQITWYQYLTTELGALAGYIYIYFNPQLLTKTCWQQ